MSSRKSISKKKRFEIFKRDKFTCQYCGESAPDVILEVDHIEPVSKGGGNDILNLITSCFDCNRGKSDRELDDSAVVNKQIDQLKELQERRDQINMMLQWKKELENEDDQQLSFVEERIMEFTGYPLEDEEKTKMRTWLNQYELDTILSSIKDALKYLERNEENEITIRSWETFFNKIPRICYVKNQIKEDPIWEDVYKVRYVVDKELSIRKGYEKGRVKDLLYEAFSVGISPHEVKKISRDSWSLHTFENEVLELISKYKDA